MALLKLYCGTQTKLNAKAVEAGALYVTTDTKSLAVDIGTERLVLNSWSNIQGKPTTFTPATHTHPYAGSSTAGGAATSANKLNTDAGSATQPVYFSNGIPVATTYTLGASVPSGAKFTDTNTWRGIQNNLTSTSTTDSLAAAQGKALNESKLGAVTANGYVGMAKPDGTTSDWIRTTSAGIIPYQAGGSTAGNAALGTSSWYFSKAYVQDVYNTQNHIGDCTLEYDSTDKCLNFNFA